MARQKLPYEEGDWCAVPLEGGGVGIGLIARVPPGGKVLLGYFFGPKRRRVPSLTSVTAYNPENAVLIRQFGDLGLITGKWPIIGHSDSWERDKWPMPLFARVDCISGEVTLIKYSENNVAEISAIPGESGDVDRYPEDGMSGYVALEIRLTKLLSSK